jgi:hypothetical protein
MSSFSFAQDQSKEIRALTDQMFSDMISKNYDALVDQMYPKVFELAPKEMLKTAVKSTLEGDEELAIEFPKTAPEYTVSKVFKKEAGNLTYAFVMYDLGVKMIFKGEGFDEDGKKMMANIMAGQGMKMTFITDTKADVIMENQMTILIKDDVTNGKWTMMNFDAKNPFFNQLLPDGIADDAAKYKEEFIKQKGK